MVVPPAELFRVIPGEQFCKLLGLVSYLESTKTVLKWHKYYCKSTEHISTFWTMIFPLETAQFGVDCVEGVGIIVLDVACLWICQVITKCYKLICHLMTIISKTKFSSKYGSLFNQLCVLLCFKINLFANEYLSYVLDYLVDQNLSNPSRITSGYI